jgi:hypothetical protein
MSTLNQYNASPVVRHDGQITAQTETDSAGNAKATEATQFDPNNHGIKAFPPNSTTHPRITSATTTVVRAVPCWARIRVQNGTMGAVTIYDNTAASGQIDFTGTPAAKDVIFGEWTRFDIGVTIVTAAATEILVETVII